jgi:tetratricopeptide (TPR) repeat protein
MKKILPQLFDYAMILLLSFLIISCSSAKKANVYNTDTTESDINSDNTNYTAANNKAIEYIGNGENEKAKEVLLRSIGNSTPRKAPYVENGTLVFYGMNAQQNMAYMLQAVAITIGNTSEPMDDEPELNKDLLELYDKTPWTNSIVKDPSYPMAYFLLGNISINLNDFDQAILYLDTATYIWDGFGSAWSELMYAYISIGMMDKAQEIGESAIDILGVQLNPSGHASVLRMLGYIAIEKNQLDKAEKLYKESLELDEDDQTAKDELDYIKMLKEQRE